MPIDRDAALNEAEKLLRQGKLDGAIEAYVRLVEDRPSDWSSINTLGDLCLRAGDVERAIEQFTRVADQFFSDGSLHKAAALYKKALRAQEDHEPALQQLGEIAVRQGLQADAELYLIRLAEQRQQRGDEQGAAESLARLNELKEAQARSRGVAPAEESDVADAQPDIALSEAATGRGVVEGRKTIAFQTTAAEPGAADFGIVERDATEAGAADFNIAELDAAEPDAPEAHTTEVDVSVDAIEVDISDFNLAETGPAESNIAEPDAAKPDAAEAHTTEVDLSDFNIDEPDAAEVEAAEMEGAAVGPPAFDAIETSDTESSILDARTSEADNSERGTPEDIVVDDAVTAPTSRRLAVTSESSDGSTEEDSEDPLREDTPVGVRAWHEIEVSLDLGASKGGGRQRSSLAMHWTRSRSGRPTRLMCRSRHLPIGNRTWGTVPRIGPRAVERIAERAPWPAQSKAVPGTSMSRRWSWLRGTPALDSRRLRRLVDTTSVAATRAPGPGGWSGRSRQRRRAARTASR
ncbi:MAG: hypothetical protein O2930_01000 [Acidobacteria bacterium]|nr:hypothetical protein [Acidobacteriota bacterium]